jgi:hypothetical protein
VLALYRRPGLVIGEAFAHFGVDGFLNAVAAALGIFEADAFSAPVANIFGDAARVQIREKNPAGRDGA